MDRNRYDVVIIGAGIIGIAAAEALSRHGKIRVALVDVGPPLALTSDKSTECYRNFWPGPDDNMLTFMNDSIDRLIALTEESGDRFLMRQQGYLFATARGDEVNELARQAQEVETFGGGGLRLHDRAALSSYQANPSNDPLGQLDGADLISDQAAIRRHFPYLSPATKAVLHVRRCGSLSAQQLGMYLLEKARDAGVEFISGEFVAAEKEAGRVDAIHITAPDGSRTLQSSALILAPGPHLKTAARKAGTDLPVLVEKHVKISVPDPQGIIPRDTPLIIWNDPIDLPWSAEEREALASSPDTERLVQTFPAGVHGRPVGAGDQVLMYWTYDCETSEEPEFPIEPDPYLPEITLRGMAEMVPGLQTYFDPMPKPYVDGGYYTKVMDNRPLIGPLDVPGTFVCGAFSGYGIMAASAAGELIAAHVLGLQLPRYAEAFTPNRLKCPEYIERMTDLSQSGQL